MIGVIDVGGVPYYDGGMSDPIPLEKCFEAGCDKEAIDGLYRKGYADAKIIRAFVE